MLTALGTDMVPLAGFDPQLALAEDGPSDPVESLENGVLRVLATFEPVSLAQMRDVALLDRMDIKYVLPQSLLVSVLSDLRAFYRVLVVAGQPISRYRTLYFDTRDLAMYRRHHAGAMNRYKVRAREYVDSQAAFLEVKHKIGPRRTVKKRIPTQDLATTFTPQAANFLSQTCPYAASDLVASLWMHYLRITLVSKQRAERVTLDLNLTYGRQAERAALPGIVVAEVKLQGTRHVSEFVRVMHQHLVRSTGFSKYCMGVSLLYPGVKHNAFKVKQRLVARVQGVEYDMS